MVNESTYHTTVPKVFLRIALAIQELSVCILKPPKSTLNCILNILFQLFLFKLAKRGINIVLISRSADKLKAVAEEFGISFFLPLKYFDILI